MEYVICDKRNFCDEAPYCGGAKPHRFDPSECGECPRNKNAKCVPVKEIAVE